MSTQLIALNRFGLGARPGEAGSGGDPQGWLLEQIDGGAPRLAAGAPTGDGVPDLFRDFVSASRAQDQERLRPLRRRIQQHLGSEVSGVLTTRAVTDRPFAERWVAFWSNHLCISVAGGTREALLAGSYERDAIRPHVFGRFEDMVQASARHPAMLYYLDNAASIGPDSPQLTRQRRRQRSSMRAQERGLNENYARELLELHTVGVDGGYTQDDVIELAKILTGWTVRGGGLGGVSNSGEIGFQFIAGLHEPGSKSVMGTRYGAGEDAGVRVIRDLSRRPETARFLAGKIATHFIDDVPPQSAIDALADRWMETEGDLGEVARALVQLDASWDPDYRKFRTPQDWLVALLRAVDAREAAPNFGQILRQLRHPLWAPSSPKGYGDLRREWADPDALMNRAELARTIADRAGQGRRSPRDLRPLATVMDVESGDPLLPMLADQSIPASERIALAFAGPAFQWR